VLAAQVSYHRGWRWEAFERVAENLTADASRRNDIIEDEGVAARFPRVGVMIRGLIVPDYEFQPFGLSWARFFPSVATAAAETFHYPPPLSPEFWQIYSEPVNEFLAAAAALQRVFKVLSVGVDLGNLASQQPEQIAGALQILQHLISPASPMPVISKDGFIQERMSMPSLLCALSLMMLQDLAGYRRLFRCKVCGKPAVAGSSKTRNCSEKCRDLGKKRRKKAKIIAAQVGD